MLNTYPSDQPIRSVSIRQVHRTRQSEASQKIRPDSVSSNQIILAGRQVGHIVIRTSFLFRPIRILQADLQTIFRRTIFVSSNHILRTEFRTIFRRTIFVSSNHILRTDFRAIFRQTIFVSSNHILRTDFRTIFRRTIFVSSNHILRTDFRTIFRRTIFVSSNKIFRSVIGETIKRFKSFEWSRTTRVTRSRSP